MSTKSTAMHVLGPILSIVLLVLGSAATVEAQDIDMDAIFTCEDQSTLDDEACNEGRQLVTNHCMDCHAFVQIVLRQYDTGGWGSLLNRHRDRVSRLTDDEVMQIRDYLAAKFNPEREPPHIPPEIVEALTDY